MIFAAEADTVARPNQQIANQWRDWMLLDDLDGGVERMRWRGRQWLPQEHREEDAQYHVRLKRSDLYPGATSALDDSVARPFTKPVTVDNLPVELEPLVQNIDGHGNDLSQFLKHLMRSGNKYGRAHVLVDYTQTRKEAAPISQAAEATMQPRAWWVLVEAPRLLGWKSFTLPSGELALSEVRIHEIRTEPDGYGEKKVEYVRVVRRDSYELWRNKAYMPPRHYDCSDLDGRFYDFKENRAQDWELVDAGPYGPEGGFESVPLVTFYAGYTGFMQARPPFIDLAETNLTHWQSSSDQRNIVHIARVPILFLRGFTTDEAKGGLTIGSGTALASSNAAALVTYVEHSGAAVGAGQDDLEQLERRMEQLGVRPHVERMKGASATGVAINADSADTDVQAWAQSIDTVAEHCFKWTATWMGNPDLVKDLDVQVFKDYQVILTGSQDVPALQADVKDGRVGIEVYLREAQRRGLYSDNLDIDAEVARFEADKAERDAKAAELQARLGGKPGGDPTKPGGKPDPDNQDDDGGTPAPPDPAGSEE